MLFPYKYINHEITKLQKWIDFLFINVWCNAEEEYSLNLLSGCSDLMKLAEDEAWKEDESKKAKDYITGPISLIYDLFKETLSVKQRNRLKNWYNRDKKINKVCNYDNRYLPLSIDNLKQVSEEIAEELYKFYKNLYDHVLDLAQVKNKNGTLKNHYDDFIKVNNKGVCGFCGIDLFRSYELEGHEAYDHYFPKENYPLYAINFKNLVPTCHKCNSIHKLRKSPVFDKENKKYRKAFYPYTRDNIDITIDMKVNISNYLKFEHDDIEINLKSKTQSEETKTWNDVYDIESRYKDVLTNESEGKYWLVQMLDEMNTVERQNEIRKLPGKLKKSRFRGKNFLRVPFLLSCKEKGLLK